MTLYDILDNIEQYEDNIDDLVKNLKQVGINNFDEFKKAKNGIYIPRNIQEQIASKFTSSEDDDWEEAQRTDTEEVYMTYLKNYPQGKYRDLARSSISHLQNKVNVEECTKTWDSIDKKDMNQLREYVAKYPDSQYIGEARTILRELQKEDVGMPTLTKQINAIMTDPDEPHKDDAIYKVIVEDYISTQKIKVGDLLKSIKYDNNFISGNVAYQLYKNGIIDDFSETGIAKVFIDQMKSGDTPKQLDAAKPLEKITKVPSTEIYFWGIPSSGKSCAIGAILSAANNGEVASCMLQNPNCQGFGYMCDLSDLFDLDNELGILPERTQATLGTTYEMGFDLEDKNGKIHPITCIDIAGEVFCAMHELQSNGKDSLDPSKYNVLQTLNNILIDNRTSNRKIHFFVIEYGAENRKYMGVSQRRYLQSAVEYINETGIFEKDTDAVYILVTKTDKANASGSELRKKLKEYIDSKYSGFLKRIKSICKDKEINNGEVIIQPFTLGEVCFQYYCRFDINSASKVVETILAKSYGYKHGKWQKIINKLKS